MFEVDSSLFNDSLKYKTKGGRDVFGGGGISPDIFVPLDTSGTGLYYSSLLWGGAINQFAFDYVKRNRYFSKNPWSSPTQYKETFQVDNSLIQEMVDYAESELKIRAYSKEDVKYCEKRLKIQLKAEIARQIWQENGFFSVYNDFDSEFQNAYNAFER
jgi:carboxyl-terminal processing protease